MYRYEYRNSKTAQTGLSELAIELRAVALFNGLRIGQSQTRCTCIRADRHKYRYLCARAARTLRPGPIRVPLPALARGAPALGTRPLKPAHRVR